MDGEARRKDRDGREGRGSPNRQPVPRPRGMLIGASRFVLSLKGPGFSMTDIVSGAFNHVAFSTRVPLAVSLELRQTIVRYRVRVNRGERLVTGNARDPTISIRWRVRPASRVTHYRANEQPRAEDEAFQHGIAECFSWGGYRPIASSRPERSPSHRSE